MKLPFGRKRSPRVTCPEWVELVTDYVEGNLPADTVRSIDTHLTRCRGCAAYLAQMRATIRTIGHLAADDVGPAMPAELRAALAAVYHEAAP